MQITFIGHAGFCVETAQGILVMDPWLSARGAFDSAWFQFPCNHHLADFVRDKLRNSEKECFVYVSHEHHDHFDPEFLASLPNHNVTYVVPRFQRAALRDQISALRPKAVVACDHGQAMPIPDGRVKLYLDDSGLNRDSAILVQAGGQAFLNMNDCKLYDELPAIVRDEGPIASFACQFSGATWHPICYEYSLAEYERISCHKLMSKFETVARAIETISPRVYLPSAGPACFLDPSLMHLNFETVNIFPRASKFLEYLRRRLRNSSIKALDIAPGDILNLATSELVFESEERIEESDVEPYLRSYAARSSSFFAQLQMESPLTPEKAAAVLDQLRLELDRKLATFTLHERVRMPLYFQLSDWPTAMLRIDFPTKSVGLVAAIADADYYSISSPAWQIARVLDGKITWEDFALTFRMRLRRRPDVYQTLIQGFLLMEPEDMNSFCGKLVEIEERKKRVIVEAGGTRFSIDQFCPHQGADLSQGWLDQGRLWTCPRHRWQFALDKGGRCLTSNTSINAVCLEGE